MFFRKVTTRRGGKEYVYLKLIETYRQAGKVKQRVIANFGNIDRLTPEKITALIQGLTRLHEGAGAFPEVPLPAPEGDPVALRAAWQCLGLAPTIREAWPDPAAPFDPALATELMVLYLALSPAGPQPVDRGCRELGLAGAEGPLKPVDFYRTLEFLPQLKMQIACHLLRTLVPPGEPGRELPWLIRVLPSTFKGYAWGLSSHGYTYQIRPYTIPLDLALLVDPRGLPLDFAVAVNRPLAREDLVALIGVLRGQCGTVPLVVADGYSAEPPPVPEGERWALRVPLENLPRSLVDAMLEESPEDFRVRTVGRRGEIYVVCHHPGIGEALNSSLDQRLAAARAQLEHIRRDIARRRLRRPSTVTERVKKTLQSHECGNFVDWTYDEDARQLTFRVREDVVARHKMQNRLLAFRTNLDREGVPGFLQSYLNSRDLQEHLGSISDCTKLPVLYPYAEYHHSENVIAGHALVYFLAYLLRRLVARHGKVVMRDDGGPCGRG
ncbi:MAG: hypothetical protein ACUVTQ_05175 [Desulfotomaculales bacterium]